MDRVPGSVEKRWSGGLFSPALVGALILLVGVVCSAVAGYWVRQEQHRSASHRFEFLAVSVQAKATERMTRYYYGLQAIQTLFSSSDHVDWEEFRDAVTSRRLARDFPGALGIAFVERVKEAELSWWLQDRRDDGFDEFAVHPESEGVSERWAVKFIAPEDRNRPALGYDIQTDPLRKEAAYRAMRTGELAATRRVRLMAQGEPTTGIVFYLPIYRPGSAQATETQRVDACVGWVAMPVRVGDALRNITSAGDFLVHLEIFDGAETNPDRVLFDEDGDNRISDASARRFMIRSPLQVGGRMWLMRLSSSPAFEGLMMPRSYPIQTGAMVLLISLLTAWGTYNAISGRDRAMALAKSMTADLARAKTDAETALREFNALRNALEEHSIISMADRAGKIIDVNAGFCRISGFTRDELIGHTHAKVNSGYHPKSFWTDMWRTISSGNVWDGIVRNRRKDGTYYWVQSTIIPFCDAAGKVERYISIRFDITSRMAIEEQLRTAGVALGHERQRLELALEAGDLGLWDWNPVDSTYIADERFRRIIGASSDAPLRVVELLRRVHSDERMLLRQAVTGHLSDQLDRIECEFRINRGDGAVRWVLIRGRVVERCAQGKPMRVVGTLSDVTERRKIEEALAEQTARMSVFVEHAPAAIAMFDREMRYIAVSHRWLTDYRKDMSLIGRSHYDVFPNLPPHWRETHQRAIRGEVLMRDDDVWRPLDSGGERHLRWELRPWHDRNGNIGGIIMLTQDITEQKQRETELASLREAADAANRAKSDFLANMSHEIRTPITAVLGYSDLLLDSRLTAEDRQNHLHVIRRNARHLLDLINDILDLSKIEAGAMEVERVPMDVPSVLSDVVSMMRPRAMEKGIGFEASVTGEIPRLVYGDPLRLRQILVNLISNAVKFTARGSIRVDCRNLPGGRLRLDVIDTGMGMSAEQQARLFRPFTQADTSTTRTFGGTGLGLTISQRLARMLGGDIHADSKVGVGSTFSVVISAEAVPGSPMFSGVAEAREVQGGAKSTPGSSGPFSPVSLEGRLSDVRVLVAEDGQDNQALIRMFLEKAGATVTIVDNGVDAVETVTSQPGEFNVVLMDMQMPRLDGYGAATELRSRGCSLPIIALTAHAMTGDRQRCIEAGCTDYATKPIDRHLLIQKVAEWARSTTMPTEPPAQNTSVPPSLPTSPSPFAHSSSAPSRTTELLRSTMADDADIAELIQEFVQRLPVIVGQIETHLNAWDKEPLTRVVHQLRGAAGGYGFDPITKVAAEAEKLLRSGAEPPQVRVVIDVLMRLIRSVEGYDQPSSRAA